MCWAQWRLNGERMRGVRPSDLFCYIYNSLNYKYYNFNEKSHVDKSIESEIKWNTFN